MKLIVGLGNPGEKYARNRHNIGFMAVDEIARGYSFPPWRKRFQGHAAEGQIGTQKCILLKPGMVRVKTGGGNAGHNGLKSISAHIGNEYLRVRLGIGHPGDKSLVTDYVLHDFAKADHNWLEPLLEGVARGMAQLVEGKDAAFLSEASRGFKQTEPARKTSAEGAPGRKAEKSPLVAAPQTAAAMDPTPLTKMDAAAARTAQPVTVPQISVVAAREGGSGGAVSSAVVISEPKAESKAAETKEAGADSGAAAASNGSPTYKEWAAPGAEAALAETPAAGA